MATKDTSGQQQRSTRHDDEEEIVNAPVASASETETKEQLDEDVDAILDEIDEVLETNAAEFVAGFVQKGGE
jgi:prokaryotic ubiquitin-like protein Pup